MKNDKILVLTPQHPIDIVDANMELADYDAMSIQMMAMLAEETYRGEPKNEAEAPYMNKDYKYWDALFLNVEKTAKTRIPRIVFGTYPKDGRANFAHIISLEKYKNDEWLYDKKIEEMYGEHLPELYTVDDVDFFFPTWNHLRLFVSVAEKGVSNDNV